MGAGIPRRLWRFASGFQEGSGSSAVIHVVDGALVGVVPAVISSSGACENHIVKAALVSLEVLIEQVSPDRRGMRSSIFVGVFWVGKVV